MTTREFEDVTLPGIEEGEILVIRSKRRKKSISAYRQGGRIVISIPARMTKADERSIVPEMIAKIRSQEAAKTPGESDLAARIDSLLTELAPEITERPVSVTWRAMRERWGSCTSVDMTIRISDRLNWPRNMLWITSSSTKRSTCATLTMVRHSPKPWLDLKIPSWLAPTSMASRRPKEPF